MDQIGIAVFGVLGIWLAMSSNARSRKWAPVVGLLGQPFWLYATWGQWGMFAVSLLYTASWARGFYGQWVRHE